MQFSPRLLIFFGILFLGAACAPAPKRITLLVDGERRVFETTAATVQAILQEQGLELGIDDRVDPPAYAEAGRSATITVTRVALKTELSTQPIPFARQLIRDEMYPQGQVRVVQLGSNGAVAITQTITLENGRETARRETARSIVAKPKDEILALGTQGMLPLVSLTGGTLAYIANGNVWVMRHNSSDKRALTATRDLDGRVFSLSGDGRYLLFSRVDENALNTLWLVNTLILNESPRRLPMRDALYAELSTDARSMVYSTGEKTPGAPGWRAHNDVTLASLAIDEIGVTVKSSQTLWQSTNAAPYSWWGANFALAPDGRAMAFAFANEVGLIDLVNNEARRSIKKFPAFQTNADWVWTPRVAWSPDSRFIASAIHAPTGNPLVANTDPNFELWVFVRDGTVSAALAKQTGMWSSPAWSPPDARGESRIAFGLAFAPSNSERSRYALMTMDRSGGNQRKIFPTGSEDGLVVMQTAWSPDGKQLVAVRDGDLWLHDFASGKWSQLTANGASALPRWAK